MRKSRSIRLVLLGCAGLFLSACEGGPPADAVFFEDLPACSARFGEQDCTLAQEQALLAHLNHAPVSLLKEECENDFGEGSCEARYMPSNRPYYVPAMKGFITAGGLFSEPVYRDFDGGALMRNGESIYRVGRFTKGFVTGVRVRSASDSAANAGARTSGTLFRRETARRISDHGFEGRPRGGIGWPSQRHTKKRPRSG